MLKENKRGVSMQLVSIIVLIVGFAVLLLFLLRANLYGTTEKEICHNSVVLEGKTPLVSTLDCKTQYTCISGGNDCTTISANEKVNVQTNEDIMKALADKMSDCWWEFGEGKVNYVGTFTQNTYCGICSIVGFDNSLGQQSQISYQEFYNYLKNTKKTNSQTYLQYLYGISNLGDLQFSSSMQDYFTNKIDFTKSYFILTARTAGIGNFIWNSNFWEGSKTNGPYPVVIMEKTTENYNKIGCDEFVTKA